MWPRGRSRVSHSGSKITEISWPDQSALNTVVGCRSRRALSHLTPYSIVSPHRLKHAETQWSGVAVPKVRCLRHVPCVCQVDWEGVTQGWLYCLSASWATQMSRDLGGLINLEDTKYCMHVCMYVAAFLFTNIRMYFLCLIWFFAFNEKIPEAPFVLIFQSEHICILKSSVSWREPWLIPSSWSLVLKSWEVTFRSFIAFSK